MRGRFAGAVPPGDLRRLLAVLWTALLSLPTHQAAVDTELETIRDWSEYCEAEFFVPTCSPSEVVVMTEARYGRLTIGRCVRMDYGYVGCSANVLPEMDALCSGRKTCSVSLPDTTLDSYKHECPHEFKTYLNATYMCVKVERASCQQCASGSHAEVSLPRAYLASVVTEEDGQDCGGTHCPWLIKVQPGQKVNITLYDFGKRGHSERVHDDHYSCYPRYGIIKEEAKGKETPLCGGRGRQTHSYLSVSNSVEVRLLSRKVLLKSGHFLVHYEAIGCPDYEQSKFMWLKRRDNILEVGCRQNAEKWELRCVGNEWEGQIQGTHCPQTDPTVPPPIPFLPLGVLIAIVVGIALVIGVLILTVGVVCLKRYMRQQHDYRQRPETKLYVRAAQDPEYRESERGAELRLVPKPSAVVSYVPGELTLTRKPPAIRQATVMAGPIRENLYCRRMESRPLPSLPNLTETSDDDSGSDRYRVQVHRTSSGRESQYHSGYNPRVSTRTAPSTGSSASRDDPPYFVLDPDELREEDLAAQQRHVARASNAQVHAHAHPGPEECGPSSSTAGGGGGAGCGISRRDQKSPEEENAENINKEVHLNNSCHEIPLRPLRDTGAQTQAHIESNNSGSSNSSWP